MMHRSDQIINGVHYITPKESNFSSDYTKLREKEGRLLTDDEVKELPHASKNNPNKNEWTLRKKSTERFLNYLNKKKKPNSILDIGCGNGWFTNLMASVSKEFSVTGLDINEQELEQAARVFNKNNLEFVYGDLFKIENEFDDSFDIITLNASVQYFKDLEVLFSKLKKYLRSNGEIHIIDSPFYQRSELEAAKKRTQAYYKKMGASEMSNHYYHHSIESVNDFEILYRPFSNLYRKLGLIKESPFMWMRYLYNDHTSKINE